MLRIKNVKNSNEKLERMFTERQRESGRNMRLSPEIGD